MNQTGRIGFTGHYPYIMTTATNVAPGSVLARLARGAVDLTVAASTFVLASATAQAHNGGIAPFVQNADVTGIDPKVGLGLGLSGFIWGFAGTVMKVVEKNDSPLHYLLGIGSMGCGGMGVYHGFDSLITMTDRAGPVALTFGIISCVLGVLSWVGWANRTRTQ